MCDVWCVCANASLVSLCSDACCLQCEPVVCFPFQIGLTLLLLLTITTLNYGAQASLPKVSYIKAIDVWFLGQCAGGETCVCVCL